MALDTPGAFFLGCTGKRIWAKGKIVRKIANFSYFSRVEYSFVPTHKWNKPILLVRQINLTFVYILRLNEVGEIVIVMAETSKRNWPWKKKNQEKFASAPESIESSPRASPHNSKFFDEQVCLAADSHLPHPTPLPNVMLSDKLILCRNFVR